MEAAQDRGKQKLIAGIVQEAQEEAAKIIAAAEQKADERRKITERQIAAIRQGAEKKAQERIAAIKHQNERSIAVEIRRLRLRAQERFEQAVLAMASEKLAAGVSSAEYPGVLVGWIVEAAIGLDARRATVNASGAEMRILGEGLLRQAEQEVQTIAGREIVLTPSQEPPLLIQGVFLTDTDRSTAFNNQVPTRMQRYKPEIGRLIHSQALGETHA